LPLINQQYAATVRLDKKEADEEKRRQLQREIEQQERMLRLRWSIQV
jgi:hypothetical protein